MNNWRIVHVTGAPDARIVALFERIATNPWLPEVLEIYLRDVLTITRREDIE